MASKEGEDPKDVTSNEEKELRRVYDYLANYAPKSELMAELRPKVRRRRRAIHSTCPPRAHGAPRIRTHSPARQESKARKCEEEP